MGHYLSEMQADPIVLESYEIWRNEFEPLQKAIRNLKLSEVIVGDLTDIRHVAEQTLDSRNVGRIYNPTYDVPGGGQAALKIAKILVEKYKIKIKVFIKSKQPLIKRSTPKEGKSIERKKKSFAFDLQTKPFSSKLKKKNTK